MWFGLVAVIVLVLIAALIRRYGNDWRAYLAIAGALLSLIVARRSDIDAIVRLPSALYKACTLLGLAFLLGGLACIVWDIFKRPASSPAGGPRPELSYAFRRDDAAHSSHARVAR